MNISSLGDVSQMIENTQNTTIRLMDTLTDIMEIAKNLKIRNENLEKENKLLKQRYEYMCDHTGAGGSEYAEYLKCHVEGCESYMIYDGYKHDPVYFNCKWIRCIKCRFVCDEHNENHE